MPAPKEILDLVARFELHLDAYKSGQYNETQLRRDFLDPFFKALGWDIDNSSGHAEAYRDVIHEDAVRIDGAVKAPDYGFRVGGQRQFFLEAKKPSVHIKEDIAPAFQLRRYAWSAKLPLSILTDFEEFAIYDCRIRPDKGDKASVGRLFYCTFCDFIEKWDYIASIFSKDAVLKGSFDKFAETNKAKRGTSEVDAAFLEEIEKWRADLASDLALRNKALTQRELNFAVQRIIDRIIFLRICEARGIENYKRLHALTEKTGIYERLCEQFKEADDRYNSGLFHFKAGKERHEPPDPLTLGLDIDDKLLSDILRGLYYPNSPYEFAVFSADILGQVYEQFLGKVIELTESHRAKVTEKPEVRKAGGVFYTPTYIVNYIVRETVGKLLDDSLPKAPAPSPSSDGVEGRGEEALHLTRPAGTLSPVPNGGEGNKPLAVRDTARVLEKVAKLRILDPACGSGSFLIGAYEFLLDWHLRFYLANNPGEWAREKKARKGSKGQHPALVQTRNGGWQLSIAERKRILLNNIYGVDLDSQAVEVTKLSLLLKVLEGEAVQAQMSLGLLDRVLPDLGDNIKCGNSLIGHDFYQQEDLPALTEDDRHRVNTFDWQKEFAEIFKDGGFDAVVGNPPWISIKGKFGNDIFLQSELNYLAAFYQGDTYRPNIYEYFVRRAQELTKQNGFQSFIVPDRLGFNEQFTELRKQLASTNRIISLLYKAPFPNVTADTLIYVWKSKVSPKNNSVEIGEFRGQRMRLDQAKFLTIQAAQFLPISPVIEKVYFQLKTVRPLGEVLSTSVGFIGCPGTITDSRMSPKQQPAMRGRNVLRYRSSGSAFFEFTKHNLAGGTQDRTKLGISKKILMRKTGFPILSTLDGSGAYPEQSLYFLYDPNERLALEYVVGILNSKFFQYCFWNWMATNRDATPQLKKVHLDAFPLRVIDFTEPAEASAFSRMVKMVKTVSELHQQMAAARTPQEKTGLERQIAATDAQIDRLVYQLYGLTESEIALVEGRAAVAAPESAVPSGETSPRSEAEAAHFYCKEEPPAYG